MKQYTHLELNREIEAHAGHYTPLKEVRLEYAGREVLYAVGHLIIDSSCCGTADYNYALVPGYILKWQVRKNKDNLPVTEVTPVDDTTVREEISKRIHECENVAQIEFW